MVMYAGNAGDPSPGDTTGIAGPRFVSCCQEELVDLELEVLQQGSEQARADGADALCKWADIAEAARHACDRALAEQYTALDERRFREVFTLAWCSGYRARARLAEAQPDVAPRSDVQTHQGIHPLPTAAGAHGDGAGATSASSQ
jgi:hypothetical protein